MKDIRKSPEYQRWRREVKHRDENTCRVCTVRRNLHVHHIKPLEKYPKFATDLDNGITLCGNCHAFLSGREESTNLQTIIEAFTGQQDSQTTEQLKRLNDKFCIYLESLLKSEDQDTVSDAVHKMFVHLQTYPDSFDQFLHLIEYILVSEKGFEDRFARQIAIEALKNHSNKMASEILGKYETSWNYQDGKKAYSQGDYAAALKKFELLAESGHAESQHYLGMIYEEGKGVVKDAKAAIKWYLKAAQQGNTEAHSRLERIYAKRRETRKKDEDALQETSLTRQSFFQNLSSKGIELCLFTLETNNVRIKIKDNRFTLLDIDRSSGDRLSRSLGLSGPLNTIFDEKLELEMESDLSETYSQLSGDILLTQEDISTLRAFLAGIKADVFVNAPTVFARVKEKLDIAKKIYYEAHNEVIEFQAQVTGLWNEEIELWLDEIKLDGDKWDRKVLNKKISDGEIIEYLRRELSFETHPEDVIYDYNQKIDRFLEALYQLEERTSIENTRQPKEEDELDELLRESRLCECDHCQITRGELDELLRESGWTHKNDEEVQKLNFTKQIEKLNEHPINQRAREILEELAPTYYEVNQALRDKIIESMREAAADYGISPWWGLDVIILLEWAETYQPIHLENELRILWTPKTEAGWEKLYDTLPMMSESEMFYHLRWLAEPLWKPDQQPKDVLDRLCGKHRPVCQELEQTREDFCKVYGDEAVQVSQGSLSADIVAFLTEPDLEEAVNTLKRLLRTAATGMWQRYSPIFYPYM